MTGLRFERMRRDGMTRPEDITERELAVFFFLLYLYENLIHSHPHHHAVSYQ